ncbi:hypothetical protein ACLK19_10885 [Escherichia coli]
MDHFAFSLHDLSDKENHHSRQQSAAICCCVEGDPIF